MVVTMDSSPSVLGHVRSALFTPATRLGSLDKAVASGCDLTIIDLEDGVAPQAKTTARHSLSGWLPPEGTMAALRINHTTTQAGLEDLLMLRDTATRWAAIVVPKVESVFELDLVTAHLAAAGPPPPVIALIETALGLDAASEIARHRQVAALALGGADLAADLGVALAWEPLLPARGRIVQAAAIGRCPAWDVPSLVVDDIGPVSGEAGAARMLGFSAKLAIHPRQVPAINAAFSPQPDEIIHAERVVAALAAAGGGACSLDGRMIDRPVALTAERILRRAALRQK